MGRGELLGTFYTTRINTMTIPSSPLSSPHSPPRCTTTTTTTIKKQGKPGYMTDRIQG
jgi:hypothetical protein